MRYCPGCLKKIAPEVEKCPYCGAPMSYQNEPHQLPVGALLENRYRIGRVLGQGGFGITYLGWDERLDMWVAVKEYYPAGYVNRYNTVSLEVMPTRGENEKVFYTRRSDFLREAKILAQFADDPNIVCVRDFFEGNNTVYIVMEFLEGVSLKQFQARNGNISFDQAFNMLSPVMRALGRVHDKGLVHRDINLSNLMLLKNGYVKLLDFGTARSVLPEGDQSLSVILTPGFAPEEQFSTRGKQGPWTDVYALSATIYKLITGITPENSINRVTSDTVLPPSACGAVITPLQERVLMKGMAVKSEYRYRSMQELADAFQAASAPGAAAADDDMTVLGPQKAYTPVQQGNAPRTAYSAARPTPSAVEPASSSVSPASSAGRTAPSSIQPAPSTGRTAPSSIQPTPVTGRTTPSPVQPAPVNEAGQTEMIGSAAGRESLINADELPREDSPEKPSAVHKGSRKNGRKINKKIFLIAGIAVAAVAVVLILVKFIGSNPYREGNSSKAYVMNETVTKSMVRTLNRDKKTEGVQFYDCVISDEVMAMLGQSDHYKELEFNRCSGFTSFAPLAKIPALQSLNSTGGKSGEMEVMQGEKLFGTSFPGITRLVLYNYVIDDGGAFLKQFPNLNTFMMMGCGGNFSFENFAGMTTLTSLAMSDVELAGNDCSGLSSCTALKFISLRGLGIEDVSWAENIAGLGEFYMSENALTSLHGLENHEALRILEVNQNAITDLDGLSGCSGLKVLEAHENAITDISGLSSSAGLTQLNLWGNQISDVSVLSGMKKMGYLILSVNPLKDFSPIASCTEIYKLHLNATEAENLDFCLPLLVLKELQAKECAISDISGLQNTTQIENLQLTSNRISDVSPLLKNKDKLTTLLLSDNEISDISLLASCVNLVTLAIDENKISDIGCVSGMKDLHYFAAGKNEISDISALAAHSSLMYTDLGDNQISDISALASCNAEKQGLQLQNNRIEDISYLPAATRYSLLSLYGNPIKDYARIASFEKASWTDYIYVSWSESLDCGNLFRSGYMNVNIVDTPPDRQVPIQEDYNQFREDQGITGSKKVFSYLTTEEADADMVKVREKAREQEGNATAGAMAYDYLSE